MIAQGIAGIQGNPQLVFRMLQFAIMMALVIAFVTWRAFKIKKNPEKSITYQDDLIKKKEMNTDIDFNQEMTIRQKLVLLTFVIGNGHSGSRTCKKWLVYEMNYPCAFWEWES